MQVSQSALQPSRSGRARQAIALALLFGLLGAVVLYARSARLQPADFRFNNGAEVQTLDPAAVSGVPEGRIVRALFEGLCVKDPRTLAPLPGAAESWSVSPDGLRYVFRIRRGAHWSNGDPLRAGDFLYSWERMLHPLTAAEYAYQLWYVKGARQYSLLDDELFYRASLERTTWLDADGGRAGVCGYALEELDSHGAVRVRVARGQTLAAGEPFVEIAGVAFVAPLGGRVTAVNDALAADAQGLAADPYEAGWIVELEPAADALERALQAGELVRGDDFRRDWILPQRLGLRAPDDETFEVELAAPTPYFLDLVGFYPLFPVNPRNIEEAKRGFPSSWQLEWTRPENLVTNGPYVVEFRRINDRIRMRKNPYYWDAQNVAFETIDALAVDRLGTALNLYLTGEVDWIDRPITNVVPRLMPREDFEPAPYLGSYFYRVNVTRPPFDDPRLRRALALTIDRLAICTNVTKAGELPAWSIVPPVLEGYPPVALACEAPAAWRAGEYERGFAADVARAKELLAEAGFGPGGATLPTIEIHYNTDETHKDLAEVIADGWKRHLGLNVKLLNQEWKVYLDTQQTIGYDVSRSSWIGDYPDANTFLDLWMTGNENNRTGWGDARYDELVRSAAREPDAARRVALLAEAESVLLDELPVLPIYYYVTRNLANPRLGGFFENFQDEHFPKFWYWMDDAELAAKRASLPADTQWVEARGPSAGLYAPAKARERAAGASGSAGG